MDNEHGEMSAEAMQGIQTEQSPSFAEIKDSPEYKAKLERVLSEVHKFAARVKELAAGKPTEAAGEELRRAYASLSDLAMREHDSLPNDATKESQHSIMGLEGSFMAEVRVTMLTDLGDGNYSDQTPARKLFEDINPGMGFGLYADTIKEKRGRLERIPDSLGRDLFILVTDYSASEDDKRIFFEDLHDSYTRCVQFAESMGMSEAELKEKTKIAALEYLNRRGGSDNYKQRMSKEVDELMEKLR